MSNLILLKKQHNEITAIIEQSKALISHDIDDNAKDIALNINTLSGKLKMHLMSEDQFLYPDLMQSSDTIAKETAQKFNQEMGGLAEALGAFVQSYNTASKILQNKKSFISESSNVFSAIENRIARENQLLYPLIEG